MAATVQAALTAATVRMEPAELKAAALPTAATVRIPATRHKQFPGEASPPPHKIQINSSNLFFIRRKKS